jgi:poly-gamma-glutamate synthesis protein (capsule biosynthesis protein)
MNPGNIGCLTAAGVDCCVLANNHVLDWSVTGLIETLEMLKSAGIRYAGAGRDADEAAAPAIVEVAGGHRAVIFGFGLENSGIPRSWRADPSRPGVNLLSDLSEKKQFLR